PASRLLSRCPPPSPTLFPYTTLFRSINAKVSVCQTRNRYIFCFLTFHFLALVSEIVAFQLCVFIIFIIIFIVQENNSLPQLSRRDRKSTRLNSSHVSISYAVFCLKKK